jgi:predicted O-methyltransferase YrrM
MLKFLKKIAYKVGLKTIRFIAPKLGFYIIPTPPQARKHIHVIKEHFGDKELVGVEIGTWLGVNAFSMCKVLNLSKLYLIDPFEAYAEYDEDISDKQILIDAKNTAKERLKEFSDKIVWIHKYSDEALNDIKEKVDFVYVDGNHGYEYVKKDIENYYEILKEGGIIAGHDLTWPGVFKAYSEFINKHDMPSSIDGTLEHWSADWWLYKK